MGKRLNIALFVALLENEFSYAVCEGAFLGAKEIDANLFIMPAGIKNAVYENYEANCYRYQYNTLYSCAKSKGFDAIIIEYGTITSFLNDKEKVDFLASLATDVPIILLAGEADGYSSVGINNKVGLEQAILHLINNHNCTRIGFLSGPVDTNQDARERLEVYIETMKKNGLECGDDYVAYGNFSEFSEGVVSELLDRHPDIEAIVCANDQMAIGAYKEIEKRGLVPGKDILLTGFDNSPVALLLEPHLTSVKADTKELAYRAVKECVDLVKNKKVIHEYVDSQLFVNNSCGCGNQSSIEHDGLVMLKDMHEFGVGYVANKIFDRYFNFFFESERTIRMKKIVESFLEYSTTLVDKSGAFCGSWDELKLRFEEFGTAYKEGFIELNNYLALSFVMQNCLERMLSKEKDKVKLVRFIALANQNLMSSIMKQKVAADEQSKIFEIVLTNITRDMMQFSKEETKKYETVLSKFRRMGALSGYVFTYEEGIMNSVGETWSLPDRIYAKAYYNKDDMHLYEGPECPTNFDEIFSDRFIASDRRCDVLVTPLYSGEKQYGLMMLETGLDKFRYASQLACQISVSIEVLDILKKQNAIKQELEINLAQSVANNKILDEMSRKDSLTGISNRRGFLDRVKTIMESEIYQGKRAIAVYADMDCLKIINDEFGHDDGDYALKTIGKALVESFRQADVVARMGGDEFAAFALVSEDDFGDIIKERIKKSLDKLNDTSGKPYYVYMSVGTYEFVIGEETNIDQILNKADTDLYHEKKNKVKIVFKPEYKKE